MKNEEFNNNDMLSLLSFIRKYDKIPNITNTNCDEFHEICIEGVKKPEEHIRKIKELIRQGLIHNFISVAGNGCLTTQGELWLNARSH